MDLNNLTRWEDSEFGPNKTDPYGSLSLYFDENSKPPGAYDADILIWKSFLKINEK
jgi:hypothetical protein